MPDPITPPTLNGVVLSSREDFLALLNKKGWEETLARMTDEEVNRGLLWEITGARDDQLPPPGDWTTWLMLGGRGAGKTRAGAEWVKALALKRIPIGDAPGRIALVGETLGDVRAIMVEGVSGILAVHHQELAQDRPRWVGMRRQLVWEKTGFIAQAFSSEDPESLRGPQFSAAWCDELAKWKHAEATWDMLQFGLRLGDRPRQMVTTTPRPIPLLKRILGDPGTVVTRATTFDNRAQLAAPFLDKIVARYHGTRLGRQELDAELIDERDGALWRPDWIEAGRVSAAPELLRIVVAVDLFHRLEADRIVAEVNQGGDMVEAIIRQQDAEVPVEKVRASRGKLLRAEPVAALYEQGRVKHVGAFPALEDEMCDFGLGGLSSGRSPDRLDALVWALSALMLTRDGKPRVRAM